MAVPGNDCCQECGHSPATWVSLLRASSFVFQCAQASFNLGIFLCLHCAGHHRGLGSHLSKVRSVDLDEWSQVQLDSMKCIGNDKAKAYWEARLVDDEAEKLDFGVFIRKKYSGRAWVNESGTLL
jgi:stromal membrane-associated protein